MGAVETLNLTGLVEWARSRGKALAQKDFVRPFKVARLLLIAQTKESFAGGHAPDGTPWAPLAHPRPRTGGADVPLRDTGILMGSVTGKGQGNIDVIDEEGLTFGTNLDRAAIHQYGGTIQPTKAGALAIPLTKDAARAGSPRNFPRPLGMVKRPGKPPLLVETTSGRRGKRKDFIGPTPLGKGAKTIFHYVLMRSVRIPARPFLGFAAKTIAKIQDAFAEFMARKL